MQSSPLRNFSVTETQSRTTLRRSAQKMSITQTFMLAHQARGKLSREAAQSDHDLRLLVGHANLLDRLMLHLSEAEQDQERWFNNSVRGNSIEDDEVNHLESLAEDVEDDFADSSDDELDEDFEEDFTLLPSQKPATQFQAVIGVDELEEFDDEEDDEDSDGLFTLTRTISHRPPPLVDDDSDSEDEPSSPPQPSLPSPRIATVSLKEKRQLATTAFYDHSSTQQNLREEYYLPERISGQNTMVRAY